jgi:FkbM family methyltransferase
MPETYLTEGVAEYVMTLFPVGYKGVCIDVGAFHPTWISNSWLFEQRGWDVYCIEPNPNCIELLKQQRKNVIEFACGAESKDGVDFYIYETSWAGPNSENQDYWFGQAADTGLIKHKDTTGRLYKTIKVNVRTLDFILGWNWLPITQIDYLSIDVEKNEMDVLRGLDLNRWKPSVIVIENEFKSIDQHAWLSSYGYVCIHRIGVNDIYKRWSG